MKSKQPRHSAEETARRGDQLYEEKIRPQMEPENMGRVVAIDVDTGTFAVEDTALAASNQLFARRPDAGSAI